MNTKRLVYAAGAITMLGACAQEDIPKEPLNVLFIITDDQNNWLEAAGFDRRTRVQRLDTVYQAISL